MLVITFRRATGAIAAAVLVAVCAGCGSSAGLGAAPLTEAGSVTEGETARIGRIQVENAFVLGAEEGERLPAGGRASVILTLVNNGPSDHLADVHSDAAESVTISGGRITAPRDGLVQVGSSSHQIVLDGLTDSLDAGSFVTLTLRFSNAGATRMELPVLPRGGAYEQLPTPEPSPSPSPSPTSSPNDQS